MQNLFSRFPVFVFSLATLASLFFPPPTLAVIKEPDNRLWGSIVLGTNLVTSTQTNIVVEARRSLSSPPIASYRMGDSRTYGDFYSLAIPLESVNPITDANATRTGEQIIVLVHNGQFVRYLTLYTVGPRGRFVRLDLGDIDSDNNGLVDNWERQFFLTAGQDPNGDPDRDGVSNRNEMLGATHPQVPDARHPADTNPTNNIITIGEVTAYALAWKTGKAWLVAPTNIPVEFVARAGYLWKNGERYIMDTNNLAAGAPLWWTNLPPSTGPTAGLLDARSSSGIVRKSTIPKASQLSTEVEPSTGTITRSLEALPPSGKDAFHRVPDLNSSGAAVLMEQRDSLHSLPPHPGPLPRGEGDSDATVRQAEQPGLVGARNTTFPLPEGEGQGEGKRDVRWPDGTGFSADFAVTVTLQVAPSSQVSAYVVEEVLPEGWTAREISSDGVFDATSRRLRWGVFFDHDERTLSYQLQPSSTGLPFEGLSGIGSFDGWNVKTAGPATLPRSLRPHLHAPVLAGDGRLTLRLEGEAGGRYEIQVSEDLIHWTTEATAIAGEDGQVEFSANIEHADRQRFYRARRIEE